ncbi:MAG: retention module-containing protein, partial [Iodobacter sp.]
MAGQTSASKPNATVVHIDGSAFLRDATGKTVPLKEGQQLNENEVFVTRPDGHVQLLMPNGELLDIGGDRTVQLDAEMLGINPVDIASAVITDLNASTEKIAAAIASGQDLTTELEATAAGLGGAGAGEEGHSFVELQRIAEGVSPLSFSFAGSTASIQNQIIQGASQTTIQAVDDALTLDEDGTATINVLANDIGSGLVITSAVATNGKVVINPDGSLTYTPDANYNGPDNIVYTIRSPDGAQSTATVNVTVTPVNDAPVGTNQVIVTAEDTPITGKLVATDKDGDPLTFTGKDQPTHGSVTVNPDGSYIYTPATDYNGKDSFTVTVDDGKGGTTTLTVDITVSPVNDAPEGSNQVIVTPEDTPITGKLVATDKDGDPLTFTGKDQPTHGSVTVNPDGSYIYTPATDYNGKDSFTVTVDDGKGGTTLLTVDITVNPVSDPAVITGQASGQVTEDLAVTAGQIRTSGKLDITDPDAGEAVFQPQTGKVGSFGTFSIDAAGNWSYTADNNRADIQALDDGEKRTDSFTVLSADGTTATIIVTINGTNDAPVATAASLITHEGDPIATGQLQASDVDTHDQGH